MVDVGDIRFLIYNSYTVFPHADVCGDRAKGLGVLLLTHITIFLQVKQGLMFWGKPDAPPIDLPPFIRNKIAQAIVSILQVLALILPL
jgi:hypothetical protein